MRIRVVALVLVLALVLLAEAKKTKKKKKGKADKEKEDKYAHLKKKNVRDYKYVCRRLLIVAVVNAFLSSATPTWRACTSSGRRTTSPWSLMSCPSGTRGGRSPLSTLQRST